jgi:N-acylneuraminate cytidylyltransferase
VVPATAPLRRVADLERCLAASLEPGVDMVITVSEARRNPWFNMVTVDDDGTAHLVLEPEERIHRRQDAPPVFDVGTVAFVADPRFVQSATSIYDGVVKAVEVEASTAIDIDTRLDLEVARIFHRQQNCT